MVPSNFRLGYACICTELREQNIFSSRTLRLSTLNSKSNSISKELAIQNLKDLLTMLKWNKKNDIYFMRLSSEIFPFATHKIHGYSLDFADTLLKEIGSYAKEHNIRITMHPAQFNVLSSPHQNVVNNSFDDLNHHANILSRMNLDQNSVIIIHGGGSYGNKIEALNRFSENFKKLPVDTQNRIVVENCELAYTVEDLLPLSHSLDIPIVIDFHHDSLNKSSRDVNFYFDKVFEIWHKKNIKPKVHVSNSVPGTLVTDSMTAKRKHSDYIYYLHDELLQISFPIDVMLECKMKEQSIFKLRASNNPPTITEPLTIQTNNSDSKLIIKKSKKNSQTNSLTNQLIKLNLSTVITKSKLDHKNEILKQENLKLSHVYCKKNKLSISLSTKLIQSYIKYHLQKNKLSSNLQLDNPNYEIKISNGGKDNNEFNYVQFSLNNECDYILTAYHLTTENIHNLGELYIFKLSKYQLKILLFSYGNYSLDTKQSDQITIDDLNNPLNQKEFSLSTKYGDDCWKTLMNFRIENISNI